jgi:hypothetical protein
MNFMGDLRARLASRKARLRASDVSWALIVAVFAPFHGLETRPPLRHP